MTNKRNFQITCVIAMLTFSSACSNLDAPTETLRAPDYADAASTALGVAQGFGEANPIVAIGGDAAAPVVALGLKYALREALPAAGVPQDGADAIMDAVGWIGFCNNVALITGTVTFPASLGIGAGCGAISTYVDREALLD